MILLSAERVKDGVSARCSARKRGIGFTGECTFTSRLIDAGSSSASRMQT